jgi:putative nucleotidyltransferase with HDIG domain
MNAALDPIAAAAPVNLETLHRHVDALPALPQALLQALATLRSDTASAEECAAPIARDPAMAARTLRLANSAFYGMQGRVVTVRDAVHLLGRGTLTALLTAAAMTAQFAPSRCAGFNLAAFWRHALATAIAAQSLAAETGFDEETAFITGLMHDIGLLALAACFPAELASALAAEGPALAAERAVFGLDHAAVGAMITRRWHFPEPVVSAIAEHHAAPAAEPTQPALRDLVQLADAVAHSLDIDAAAFTSLTLSPAQCRRVVERTESGVAALCQALGVDA